MPKSASWNQRIYEQAAKRSGDHRSPFQRDKARILHSAAFRRLQAKTQVLGVGVGDFYRTRLTHSLEASQIGQGITAQLKQKFPDESEQLGLNDHLIEALCLAHDIGHPPYGHGGEVALNYMMHKHGGFEGNGQTFRIVSKLEPYTQKHGMNLSRRTLLGLVKYPNFMDSLSQPFPANPPQNHRQIKASDWHPAKGLYTCDKDVFSWLTQTLSPNDQSLLSQTQEARGKHSKTRFKSFDCSIMELADDIAYAIHDLEDAIVMGVIKRQDFIHAVVESIQAMQETGLQEVFRNIDAQLFSEHHYERKNAIGALVNIFITSIEIRQVEAKFEQALMQFNAVLPETYSQALSKFKDFVFQKVIRKPEIQLLEYKGQQVVIELFEAFASDPERLLPENTRKRWLQEAEKGNGFRVISDYISGMTDEFAARLHNNLFSPAQSSMFK